MTRPGGRELADLAVRVAVAAGQFIRDRRPDDLAVAATKTSAVDVVTHMDTAAERLIIEQVMAARPHDGVLGEEGGLLPGDSGLTWVIDPIDATVNYLYGVGTYAVSVAVVDGEPDPQTWTPMAGCVYDPLGDVRYHAMAGAGAFADRRALPGPNDVDLAHALVATGFGYLAARRRKQAQVLTGLLPRVRDIRRLGCAALDLCLVADGRVDAYYERGLNPWDHAASGLVATESGVLVTGPHGLLPGHALLVAAGPRLHPQLLGLLDGLGAYNDDCAT
ncbi:MAG: inositol monophosphatase family protein [Actinomycetales bacterium]